MKQQVKVNNTIYQVDYEKSAGRIKVTVDDQSYLLDATAISGGFYSLLIDGKSHDVQVDGDGNHFSVFNAGKSYNVDFYDPRSRRPGDETARSVNEGQQIIYAPMAGRIVRFQVEPGDMVDDGDGLIVLEAMKMENELKSQGIGQVKEICVSVDDVVTPGKKIMVIE